MKLRTARGESLQPAGFDSRSASARRPSSAAWVSSAGARSMSVGTLLLPVRIESRSLAGHEPDVVVALRQQDLGHLAERNFAALPRILDVRRAERKPDERHCSILLGQRVAREFQDRRHAERCEAFLVNMKPPAVLR